MKPSPLVFMSLALSFLACGGAGSGEAKKDDALALSSPTLCKHVKELKHAELSDDTRCVMRLDGLQLQLGPDDWKKHAPCIRDAGAADAVDACLKAADEFSLAKHSKK